jgi:tetratricopeptide (TPR) repeat protein
MPRIHPKPDFNHDLAARLSAEERKLLRHAVDCTACRGLFLSLLEVEEGGRALARVLAWPGAGRADIAGRAERAGRADRGDYGAVIDGVLERCHPRLESIVREQSEAPARVEELLRHPPERRWMLVENHRRFVTLSIAERLLRASRGQAYTDPAAGEELAALALGVADRLDPALFGERLLADTRARCFLATAHARRIAADLRGADEAFALAEEQLRLGTRDALERARLFYDKAALRRAQRRLGEAAGLLDRAIAIYRSAGETHSAGEAILARGVAEKEAGFPERAIDLLREASRLIDPALDPRLTLCVRHNLIDWLTDAGRALEAQGLMARSGEIYRRFEDLPTRLRRLWVLGKIARGLGQLEEAARLFGRVREGWIELGIGYDAALAALDLAGVSAQLGRTAEVRRLAEEMLPIFRSRDVHREAVAALIVFQRAASGEHATQGLVEELSIYLRKAAAQPGLAFEPAR